MELFSSILRKNAFKNIKQTILLSRKQKQGKTSNASNAPKKAKIRRKEEAMLCSVELALKQDVAGAVASYLCFVGTRGVVHQALILAAWHRASPLHSRLPVPSLSPPSAPVLGQS